MCNSLSGAVEPFASQAPRCVADLSAPRTSSCPAAIWPARVDYTLGDLALRFRAASSELPLTTLCSERSAPDTAGSTPGLVTSRRGSSYSRLGGALAKERPPHGEARDPKFEGARAVDARRRPDRSTTTWISSATPPGPRSPPSRPATRPIREVGAGRAGRSEPSGCLLSRGSFPADEGRSSNFSTLVCWSFGFFLRGVAVRHGLPGKGGPQVGLV